MKTLKGKVAVVAGATRGAGRGIACALGEAGALVYCTGRSVRGKPATANRPETIEETAEMVTARGGKGIAVRVDHTQEREVESLFQRVADEQQGQLDIVVNDIWGGEELAELGTPFWELSLDKGFLMFQRAVHTHIITSRYAAPLMIERQQGLIIEVTDGDNCGYRGNLFFDLAKTSVIRIAYAMATELRKYNVSAIAVTPGFMRSESMLEGFGVTEANWQEAAKRDPHFIASETPLFVGRGVVALASDVNVSKKSGRVFGSWELAREYNFVDADGSRPDWDAHMKEVNFPNYERLKKCDEVFYSYWVGLFDEI